MHHAHTTEVAMLSLLRGAFRRPTRCDHRFGEWKFYRSRLTGWMQIRYCASCSASENRQVRLRPLPQA